MSGKPFLHFRMFVRGVVVGDQVNTLFFRRNLINDAQELQLVLMAMPVIAHADHGAVQRVQRCKEWLFHCVCSRASWFRNAPFLGAVQDGVRSSA